MDKNGVLQKGAVLLHPVLLLVGPQHLSRALGHLSLRRHLGQQHQTAQLWYLAGDDLRPLVERSLQALPPRLDHAGRLRARPARARLGVLLAYHCHPVLGALVRPQLGGSRLSICTADIRLLGRLAPGRFERRRRRLARTRQSLLPPLLRTARVHHHGEDVPSQGTRLSATVEQVPGRCLGGGVWANTPPSSHGWRATASALTRSQALEVAGKRGMHRVSARAARLASVPRAASAMERDAPGRTPYCAQRWAISDHSVVLRVLSAAWPSSAVPQMGTARSPQRVDRTNGLRSGRVSLL
jgi:hypothetical protein